MADENLTDVVEILLRKRDYHAKQLEIIDKMLSVANPNRPQPLKYVMIKTDAATKGNTPWTKLIREIFVKENTVLTRKGLKEKMVEMGTVDEKTVSESSNTIIGIVSRLVKQGELTKTEDGLFHRGPKHPQALSEKALAELERL